MDDVVELIRETGTVDSDFNAVGSEVPRSVFCRVKSVARSEFYTAGQLGLNPSLTIEIFFGDYKGERLVRFRGQDYAVYRTYHRIEDDTVELYVEQKAGVTDGDVY